jgi:hypothetical protein
MLDGGADINYGFIDTTSGGYDRDYPQLNVRVLDYERFFGWTAVGFYLRHPLKRGSSLASSASKESVFLNCSRDLLLKRRRVEAA